MHIKKVIGLLGSASFGIASAALNDSCVPSISTVFVTSPPIYSTVTVKQTVSLTVYVTAPPTSTLVNELPIPSAGFGSFTQDTGEVQSMPVYDTTVYETAYVTVTLDGSATSAPNGPLSFMVINGTTTWLGDTPSPCESLVYASSTAVITVLPQKHAKAMTTIESTTTVRSTVQIETTVTLVITPATSTVVGTATFTGKPSGGWNATMSGSVNIGETALAEQSTKPTLVLHEPTFNLFPTTNREPIKISSYAAASGFRSYTTLTAPTLTSSPGGSTTAVVRGETLSWTVPTMPTTLESSSIIPVFENTTLATLYTASSSSLSSSAIISSEVSSSTGVLAPTNTSSVIVTSAAVSSTPPSSTQCGLIGNFMLMFDDIPPLAIGNQSIDDVQPVPIFNPYQKFKFSDGFFVVPPPRVPYQPSSKPLLLEFLPNFNAKITDQDTGPNSRQFDWSGDIGNADQGRSGCFSYNMYGASLGCDSRVDDCIFTFSGFRYDQVTKLISEVTSQKVAVAACPELENCSLASVTLDGTFENLDVVRVNVKVGVLPKIWWMDDVRLGWYNNTCSVGICRQNTRIR